MNTKFNKWIARGLILTMVNPAMYIQPAAARDTSIYSGFFAESSTTIRPNILLLLDTSDSMNLPEAWREYEGGYDSHVEYLWNDLELIVDADSGSSGEFSPVEADRDVDAKKISTAATPTEFYSKWGHWSGATPEKRRELWQAARNSAKETISGDPGEKYFWRKYDDLSWIYWLPADTAESDARLRSPSWSRFRGYIQELGNGTGGTLSRGGPNYTDTNDFRAYNKCDASNSGITKDSKLYALTPSTVLVPSSAKKNEGKFTGEQWARWERFTGLSNDKVSGYPGSSTQSAALGGSTQYAAGYLDVSTAPTGNPTNNPVYRDSHNGSVPFVAGAPFGNQGLPIRYDGGSARATWGDLKGDMGGFILRKEVADYTDRARLEQVMTWYGLPTTSDIDSSGATDISDAKFLAWKGNRDATGPAPAFGSVTGVPAYIDTVPAACSATTGPSSTTCLPKSTGGSADFTLTKTATCGPISGQSSEVDAGGTTRLRGGTCGATISQSGTDTNGASFPSFSDVPDPVCAAPNSSNDNVRKINYSGCSISNTGSTTAATCTRSGDASIAVSACAWSGGTPQSIAGCAWNPAQSTTSVGSCGFVGRSTATIGTCAWAGHTATYTEGVGWFPSGGSCQQGGSTSYCSASGTRGGPYSTKALALAATAGCSNSTPAGTYNYGGSCEESGATSSCSVSGGTTVTIGGTAYSNVNGTCSNSITAGTYAYGGSCTENGATDHCKVTGGTLRTIRGLTKTFGETCGQKDGTGTWKVGGTCSGTNNTCTSTTTNKLIRGTNYTVQNTCTGVAAGTYWNNNAVCTGGGGSVCTKTNASGTSVVSGGVTYYATRGVCTGATGTHYASSTCYGTKKELSDTVGGGVTTTTGAPADACDSTSTTVTVGGIDYKRYLTCTAKGATNQRCATRYGAGNCTTDCTSPAPEQSKTGGKVDAANVFYRVFNFSDKDDYLVHDCKADESGSSPTYMRNLTGGYAPSGTAYNTSTSSSTADNTTASYTATAIQGVAADATKKVDMYSVNYLNWKYGPKGPTGQPIGRKTRLQIAKDVLTEVVTDVKGVRLGLMAFNQLEKAPATGKKTANSSGAHLVKAVTDLDDANRAAFITSINALNASSATPLTESLYESYLYFRGETPLFGGSAYQAKESALSTGSPVRYVTEGIDLSSDAIAAGKYKSPITATCQSNMIILVSDGAPENDADADTQILALPDHPATGYSPPLSGTVSINQGGTTGQFIEPLSGLPYGPASKNGVNSDNSIPDPNYVLLDELAYYMNKADALPETAKAGLQNIQLSTVKFGVEAPVLDKAAAEGGGNSYTAKDAKTLKEALEAALRSVVQWQPQGSMPAITYNATTGASGDIFLAAFSPSSNVTWPGTIKKYSAGFKLNATDTSVCGDPVCGNPDSCIAGKVGVTYGVCGRNVEKTESVKVEYYDSSGTLGERVVEMRRIRPEAVSYWIPDSPADGGSGSKGGTGQILIGSGSPNTRNLYTFLSGTSTSATLSATGNLLKDTNAAISKTILGNASMTDATRSELIAFAQGSDGAATTSWRAWPHYDSVHSSPVADGSSLYYLTSDGMVHAIDTSETGNGRERWAFMVEEGLSQISAVKANLVGDHLEVADGNPVIATTVDGKKLVIFGLRRGGRAYYAIDVTNPDSPLLAWKITSSAICNGASCAASATYSELGQAWSTPTVGYVRGYKDLGASATDASDDKFKPVLVFGGGYDTNQDLASPGNDTMGRAIFVVDAADGSLLRKFSTIIGSKGYSVPADVLAIDTTGDSAGTLDRVYVGDMGGHLWRMDLDDRTADNLPTSWSIVRLADLSTTARTNKLFNRPTMAAATYMGQVFDAVFVGGGDLQNPAANTTNDSGIMFMVKDKTVAGVAIEASSVPSAAASGTFVDMTDHVNADALSEVTDASSTGSTRAQDLKASEGYFINLKYGEKVSSSAQVFSGNLFFGTYFPSQAASSSTATQCRLGGYGNQYVMDALTGMPISSPMIPSSGNPRVFAYVAGFGVGLNPVGGGVGKGIFLQNRGLPASSISNAGVRIYWYSVPER